MLKSVLASAVVMSLILPGVAMSRDIWDLRTELQSSLQRGIERQLVDGALQRVNPDTGQTELFYPLGAHEMIVQTDTHFVMCTDLRAADGSKVEVDFYLQADGAGFSLVHFEIDNRGPLRNMMRGGRAWVLK